MLQDRGWWESVGNENIDGFGAKEGPVKCISNKYVLWSITNTTANNLYSPSPAARDLHINIFLFFSITYTTRQSTHVSPLLFVHNTNNKTTHALEASVERYHHYHIQTEITMRSVYQTNHTQIHTRTLQTHERTRQCNQHRLLLPLIAWK